MLVVFTFMSSSNLHHVLFLETCHTFDSWDSASHQTELEQFCSTNNCCTGTTPCANWPAGAQITICEGACNGYEACHNVATMNGQEIYFGANSCNGDVKSCAYVGYSMGSKVTFGPWEC